MSGRPPRVSVVVAARNAAAHLRACLDSLAAQEEPPHEVIVVDDASSDDTAAIAAAWGATVVTLARRSGPSGARNAGARHASGDLLAFIDSDAVARGGWVRHLADAAAAGATLIAGALEPDPPRTAVEAFSHTRGYGHDLDAGNGFLPAASTANLAVARVVFWALGGFDERLRAGEDHDLSFRAQLCGHHLLSVPEAEVSHRHRSTVEGLIRQCARNARDAALLGWKYQSFPFFDARRRGNGRRPWLEAAQGGAWSLTLGWRHNRQARLNPWLEAITTATLRTSARLGTFELIARLRQPPRPLRADGVDQVLAARPIARRPAVLVTGDDRAGVRLVVRALRAHPRLAVAPATPEPDRRPWEAEPPWTWGLVRDARAAGWRMGQELAARRLESGRPRTWGEAWLDLHAIHAWLQGKGAYGLVTPPEQAAWLLCHLGDVPVVVVGGASIEVKPDSFLAVDRDALVGRPESVAGDVQAHAGIPPAPSVARVLTSAATIRLDRVWDRLPAGR